MKRVKIILNLLAVIFIALSMILVIRVYMMTRVEKVSLDKISQPPQVLEREKIVYFEDFREKELIKYREFLEKFKIGDIKSINGKVLFVTNMINSLHNHGKGDNPEYVYIGSGRRYCQDATILLSSMLNSINIYTRNWHASWQDNQGFHQFLEYYNFGKNRWIIIDPYYGIQYEADGELMGVVDVAEAVLKGTDVKKIIKVLDIERATYSAEYVEDVWENKMIMARVSDFINYVKPTTRYGILAKFSFFDLLPAKVKKLFRVLGRNNSMHEAANFKKIQR